MAKKRHAVSFSEYVDECTAAGESLADVGRRLGMSSSTLHRWHSEGLPETAVAFAQVVLNSEFNPSPTRGFISLVHNER